MIEIACTFVVKEECRGQFELAYGPGGEWSKLYARSQGFRGITLLRDTENPRRYLAIEVWDTLDQRQQRLAEIAEERSALDTHLAAWTESAAKLGTFRVRAEATVRQRSRTRQRGTDASRRGASGANC